MRTSVVAGLGGVLLALVACGGKSKEVHPRGDSSGSSGDSFGGSGNSSGGSLARGGTSSTGGSGAAGMSSDWVTTCDRVTDIICVKLETCAPELASLLLQPDCRTSTTESCLELAQLPDTSLTPERFQRCYDEFEAIGCEAWLYDSEVPADCVFRGTRPVGGPCGNDAQCATADCTATFGACGVCETPAQAGESCLDDDCEPGLTCSTGVVCAPPKHLGDPCDVGVSDDCGVLLVCEGGSCARAPGAGEACGNGPLGCDLYRAAFCDRTTGRCEALTAAREGEPCDGICTAGLFCNPYLEPPTCVAAAREGEPCTTTGGLECEAALDCTNGVCTRVDPATCN